MRKFDKIEKPKLISVTCNCCGRQLKVENGELKEGCFAGRQAFGYFSSMDGEMHSFDLCEACYHELTKQFCIPVLIEQMTELV
ncbi:MAG: hypothetical protein IKC46_12200 [Lachnospiraceae bacterium]|nr:hypothetical protein [Lachnospiraceae bacterium]